METGYATVADDVPDAIVNALDGHHIRGAFQHLQIDCAVTASVSRLRNDLRTEFAGNVRFLLAVDVCRFGVAHPMFD